MNVLVATALLICTQVHDLRVEIETRDECVTTYSHCLKDKTVLECINKHMSTSGE